MIATSLTPQIDELFPLPISAIPQADDLVDLIIYDYDEQEPLESIDRVLQTFNCRVMDRQVTPRYLHSGTESFKVVVTLDMSRCDREKVRQWHADYSQMVDTDLKPHRSETIMRRWA